MRSTSAATIDSISTRATMRGTRRGMDEVAVVIDMVMMMMAWGR